jgi:WD40 repeat protein
VAWFIAGGTDQQKPGQINPQRMVGIDQGGAVVGQIDNLRGFPLRSPDGQFLYLPWVESNDSSASATVEKYDAKTGAHLGTMRGRPLTIDGKTVASGRTDFDAIKTSVSPDGRYLAILHKTRRLVPGTIEKGVKYLPNLSRQPSDLHLATTVELVVGKMTTRTSLELLDLSSGQVVDNQELYEEEGVRLGGELIFAPNGQIYEFTSDAQFRTSVTIADSSSGTLGTPSRQLDDGSGSKVPVELQAFDGPYRFSAGGTNLVRFGPPEYVDTIDLQDLSLLDRLAIGFEKSAKPYRPVALFTPDGKILYVVHSASGTIRSIDLVNKKVKQPDTLPTPSAASMVNQALPTGPRAIDRRGIAALASDAQVLFVVDGRLGSGVSVVQPSTMSLLARPIAEQAVRDLFPGPDGQSVFAMIQGNDGLIVILHGAGEVAGAVRIGTPVVGMI